jgi:hypothetical protein
MDLNRPGKYEAPYPLTSNPPDVAPFAQKGDQPIPKAETENGTFRESTRRITISTIRERLESPAPSRELPLSSAERDELQFLRSQIKQLIAEKEDVQAACRMALSARDAEMKTLLTAYDKAERELAESLLRVRSAKASLLQAAYVPGLHGENDGNQGGLVGDNLILSRIKEGWGEDGYATPAPAEPGTVEYCVRGGLVGQGLAGPGIHGEILAQGG